MAIGDSVVLFSHFNGTVIQGTSKVVQIIPTVAAAMNWHQFMVIRTDNTVDTGNVYMAYSNDNGSTFVNFGNVNNAPALTLNQYMGTGWTGNNFITGATGTPMHFMTRASNDIWQIQYTANAAAANSTVVIDTYASGVQTQ